MDKKVLGKINMVLYKKREKFSGFSIKVGTFFSKFGLSPNQ